MQRRFFSLNIFSRGIGLVMVCAIFHAMAQPVYATHFRYGHYYWVPKGGNTIEFTLQNAWRRDGYRYGCMDPATLSTVPCTAPDGLPAVGDVIWEFIGATQFQAGDGTIIGSPLKYYWGSTGPFLYLVTSIDPASNWLFALALDPNSLPAVDPTISHAYPSQGDFLGNTFSCCRISASHNGNAHINNPDGMYRVETLLNVGTGNHSPVSTMPPIVRCPVNGLCSFTVPGSDPDGDALNFRLSTSVEASGASYFTQPGPPFALRAAQIDPITGVYNWDTSGAKLGPTGSNTLYSTQVTIQDLNAQGSVQSKVAVDFLIQLVPVVGVKPVPNSPPTPECGSTQAVAAGDTITFTVQGSDSDPGQTVELNVAGLPAGATLTPPLPTSGNPVSSGFSWTPSESQIGTHVLTFTLTDNTGQQSLCSNTVEVKAAPQSLPGRMAGGGKVSHGFRVTHGFQLACVPASADNNLEVNWGKGDKFHLDELTDAICSDDPSIDPGQPGSVMDVFKGKGTGRFNGKSGAAVEFTFTDAGEPGKSDLAEIVIRDARGNVVLSVSGPLENGNHQALNE